MAAMRVHAALVGRKNAGRCFFISNDSNTPQACKLRFYGEDTAMPPRRKTALKVTHKHNAALVHKALLVVT